MALSFFPFSCFLGLHLQHMEVDRLGVKSELQLPAYTPATATPDLSLVCDLHHSSRQCRILNPLRKARDRTRNLMVPSRILQPLRHDENSWDHFYKNTSHLLKAPHPNIITLGEYISTYEFKEYIYSL